MILPYRFKQFNEQQSCKQSFFFSEDGDGHWYMIPIEHRDRWNDLKKKDYCDGDYELWQFFEDCRLAGGIEDIEFVPTKYE